jgi:hypothetical protein
MISRREFIKIGGLSIAVSGLTKSFFANPHQDVGPELKNMVSDVKPLTNEDYEKRLEKAKRLLIENKIDALFLSGST